VTRFLALGGIAGGLLLSGCAPIAAGGACTAGTIIDETLTISETAYPLIWGKPKPVKCPVPPPCGPEKPPA